MVVGDGLPESATRGAALRAVEPDGSHPVMLHITTALPLSSNHIFFDKKKHLNFEVLYCQKMVVEDGFEPSKSVTADLQSAPFGRSGIPPQRNWSG